MLAARRQAERTFPRKKKTNRQCWLLRFLLFDRVTVILASAAIICFGATVYIGAYARVTVKGYEKADMVSQLNNLKIENQELRIKLDTLRRPDRITQLALARHMRPATEMAFLKSPDNDLWVAENTQGQR